jgi:hypothetical protein
MGRHGDGKKQKVVGSMQGAARTQILKTGIIHGNRETIDTR